MYAPGHLGELTQIVDFVLVDTVIEETGSREKRMRLLPSRVVVYFVLALALFEDCSYRGVWGRLTAGLEGLPLVRPAVSSLSRARRRIGAAPLRRLFEILAGPLARLGQAGSFYRGLRTVAVDGILLHVPDEEALTWRYPERAGESVEVRLPAAATCGPGRVWHPCRPGRRVRPRELRRTRLRRPPVECAGPDDAPAGRCRLRCERIRPGCPGHRRPVPGTPLRPPGTHPLPALGNGSYPPGSATASRWGSARTAPSCAGSAARRRPCRRLRG
ncbi:transposase domain-containing protein [Streptomyces scopuliridis]